MMANPLIEAVQIASETENTDGLIEAVKEASRRGNIDELIIEAVQEASRTGNIGVLYPLIGRDANVLKRMDEKMLVVDTPLHIAASLGNTRFAMEILDLMPSLATKLNESGRSPMHLALETNNSRLVLLLLRANSDLVRVKGKGGVTPLHYATKHGFINLVAYFLAACPESIEDVTVQGQTVFHIAVEKGRVDALQVLVGWMERVYHKDAFYWEETLPNWKDEYGRTVVDIAKSMENVNEEILRLLDRINAKDSQGKRASQCMQAAFPGLLERVKTTLFRSLRRARNALVTAITSILNQRHETPLADYLSEPTPFLERSAVLIERHKRKMSDPARSAFLVVAGLILAPTFRDSLSIAPGFYTISYGDYDRADGWWMMYFISASENVPLALSLALVAIIGVLLPEGFTSLQLLITIVLIMSTVHHALSIQRSMLTAASDSTKTSDLNFGYFLFLNQVVLVGLTCASCFSFLFLQIYWAQRRRLKLLYQDNNRCPREAILSSPEFIPSQVAAAAARRADDMIN